MNIKHSLIVHKPVTQIHLTTKISYAHSAFSE